MYLFVIQQTVSGREAEVMGVELGGLLVIVELKTGCSQRSLQHFYFPVVDGNLQVVHTRLLRWIEDRGRIYCKKSVTYQRSHLPRYSFDFTSFNSVK